MKYLIFISILIFQSCLGQSKKLRINQYGKVYDANSPTKDSMLLQMADTIPLAPVYFLGIDDSCRILIPDTTWWFRSLQDSIITLPKPKFIDNGNWHYQPTFYDDFSYEDDNDLIVKK